MAPESLVLLPPLCSSAGRLSKHYSHALHLSRLGGISRESGKWASTCAPLSGNLLELVHGGICRYCCALGLRTLLGYAYMDAASSDKDLTRIINEAQKVHSTAPKPCLRPAADWASSEAWDGGSDACGNHRRCSLLTSRVFLRFRRS